MRTNELSGAALDWAVAKCELLSGADYTLAVDKDIDGTLRVNFGGMYPEWATDWQEGGAIIEREKIGFWWATHFVDDEGVEYGNHWYAEYGVTDENADKTYQCQTGTTPLIAAMRCYVASKLGDNVELPEELK